MQDGSFQRVHDILEAAVTHHPLAPVPAGRGGLDRGAIRLDPPQTSARIERILSLDGAETIDLDTVRCKKNSDRPETNLTGGEYGRASTTCPPLDNSLEFRQAIS